MTNPYLTLEGVSCVLPDGRQLFSGLSEVFDQRHTGLVGRNGVGKSMLARILAAELEPSTGSCRRSGSVYYLPQQAAHAAAGTVAGLAGVQAAFDALLSIESGSTAARDFDVLADRWDIRQRLQSELDRNGLEHLTPETPAQVLSGGEAMRVSLIGALLAEADFLILDEPTNHLDRPSRAALISQLQNWRKGLLVISHDRCLQDTMDRILELSPLGLRSYGGGYRLYAQQKREERARAEVLLEQRKQERRREEKALREQRERQERREARGKRQGREANQAKILLDRQKERSEGFAGRLRQQQVAARDQLNRQVSEAAKQVADEAMIALHPVSAVQTAQRRLATLENVVLPFAAGATRNITLSLRGRQRIAVIGPNGCGKSTLLRVLAGHLAPLSGECRLYGDSAYLDQRLAILAPEQAVVARLREVNPAEAEDVQRMKLAQLGLDTDRIAMPSRLLSGGERLKAVLACVLYAARPAPLLLLDEPDNHLDLPSLQALETMLRSYQGTLVVVSHDDRFLSNLALSECLAATEEGWQLLPWQ